MQSAGQGASRIPLLDARQRREEAAPGAVELPAAPIFAVLAHLSFPKGHEFMIGKKLVARRRDLDVGAGDLEAIVRPAAMDPIRPDVTAVIDPVVVREHS